MLAWAANSVISNCTHQTSKKQVQKHHGAQHEHIQVEENKLFLVPKTEAGPYPGTMVVHSDNTPITLTTVVSFGRLN